ncbi:MAG: GNAT family N-acetyltransferase [Caldimonas sp.]
MNTLAAGLGPDDPPPFTAASLRWRWCRFGELSVAELQNIYAARQQVFAVEQQCIYVDADGHDEAAYHLAAWSPAHRVPLAYARLLDPGQKYPEPSIGRVLTIVPARGHEVGRELVGRIIAHCAEVWPQRAIRISAQSRLERFYAGFGFVSIGAPYLEDGIPHTEMLRPAPA